MTHVDIDKDLYINVKKILKNKELKIDYTSINDFVNKAIKDKLRLELIRIKELE